MRREAPSETPVELAPLRPPRVPRRDRPRSDLARLGQDGLEGLSGALRPLESALPAGIVPGWRIYTVAATMPTFDPATWRLRRGAGRAAVDPHLRRAARACRARSRSRLPLRHGLVGEGRPLGRSPLQRSARRCRAAPRARTCSRSSRRRQPYVDTLTLAAGAAPRRDARLRDGRQAAPARARRAGAAS